MEIAKIVDDIVVDILSMPDDRDLPAGYVPVSLDGGIFVGDDVRKYDSTWEPRPIETLVAEGLITLRAADPDMDLPDGTLLEKVKDGVIVNKSVYDFTKEGLLPLDENQYLDDEREQIVTSTIEEMAALGKIDQAAAEVIIKRKQREQAKRQRALTLDSLTVDMGGVVYQADETSQGRMARAIVSMDDQETIPWVAYDNTPQQLTRADLKIILRLAGEQQTAIWYIPTETTTPVSQP